MTTQDAEAARIVAEYDRREREIATDFYSLTRPANLFLRHGQQRSLLHLLNRQSLLPLGARKILEVGCGSGDWFATFLAFDADPHKISGIELRPDRAAKCRERFPCCDVRDGDARYLPWPDAEFDIVLQSTVFSSVLNRAAREQIAAEMLRVLRPGGCIIWYDFFYNNPSNQNVQGIGRQEIETLFAGCAATVSRVTLAPPIARKLAPICRLAAEFLESCVFLNTHYMASLRKPFS